MDSAFPTGLKLITLPLFLQVLINFLFVLGDSERHRGVNLAGASVSMQAF